MLRDRIRFLFWRHCFRWLFFGRVVDLIFPVLITVVLTWITESFLQKNPGMEGYTISLALLFGILYLYIVLGLQSLLLAKIFRGGFLNFIKNTKDRHPVTRRFGADLLRRFISWDGAKGLLSGVDSLPKLLRDIEQTSQPLSRELYAMLLKEAAEMSPNRLWATWDFEMIPIDAVFEQNGDIKPPYIELLRTLGLLYSKIRRKDDKCRIFLFKDQSHMEMVQSDRRWEKLLGLHKDWGLDKVYSCTYAEFTAAATGRTNAVAGDFVFYRISFCGLYHEEWIIGRSKSQEVWLKHEDIILEHTTGLYEQLLKDTQKN